MCLLGQKSDAQLGHYQYRGSKLDLAAGAIVADLHVAHICFLGSLHGPHHVLLTMAKRHMMLPEGTVELRLSLTSVHFLLTMASHLAKLHIPGLVCSPQMAAS